MGGIYYNIHISLTFQLLVGINIDPKLGCKYRLCMLSNLQDRNVYFRKYSFTQVPYLNMSNYIYAFLVAEEVILVKVGTYMFMFAYHNARIILFN